MKINRSFFYPLAAVLFIAPSSSLAFVSMSFATDPNTGAPVGIDIEWVGLGVAYSTIFGVFIFIALAAWGLASVLASLRSGAPVDADPASWSEGNDIDGVSAGYWRENWQ